MVQDHWLHGFNFNVEQCFEGDRYKTLAICRILAIAREGDDLLDRLGDQ